MKTDSKKTTVVVLIVVVLIISLLLYMNPSFLSPQSDVSQVTNAFVDINGDGLVDLLVSGEVIINQGQNINFQVQP